MHVSTFARYAAPLAILCGFATTMVSSAEPTRGPLPQKQQQLIRYLADHHTRN